MTATRADVMATCNGLPVTITGTGGNDVIIGTPGDDVIFAGAGNDTVYGLSGNDTICGGPDDDMVSGGPGNDIVLGDAGDDMFIADPVVDGSDVFSGGTGVDIVSYELRCDSHISVYLDGTPDSGAPGEQDTVGTDVESYLLPPDISNNPGGELSCGPELLGIPSPEFQNGG
jgi:Ca2+-binding RTX toxin-like protein